MKPHVWSMKESFTITYHSFGRIFSVDGSLGIYEEDYQYYKERKRELLIEQTLYKVALYGAYVHYRTLTPRFADRVFGSNFRHDG